MKNFNLLLKLNRTPWPIICLFVMLATTLTHCGGSRPGQLTGQIQLAGLNNMEGIQVALLGTQHRAITDETGSFTIAGIEPGEYTLRLDYPGYQTERTNITIESGQSIELPEITLEEVYTPSGEVSGFVTLPGETNHENITVLLTGTFHSTTTNTTGHFMLEEVAPGSYTLMAIKPNWLPQVVEDVEVKDGEETSLPEIQLQSVDSLTEEIKKQQSEQGDLLIRGVALLQGENDHSGIKVWLESNPDKSTLTDESGNFVLTQLNDQAYTLIFSHEGYYNVTRTDVQPVQADSNSSSGLVTLREEAAEQNRGLLKGRVLLEGQSNHANTLVQLQGISQSVVTDAEGQYMFIGIPPGQYNLSADHPGYNSARRSGVRVSADQITSATPVTLTRIEQIDESVGSIEGTALLEGEMEHGGITVAIEGTQFTTVTGSSGDFQLTEIPYGAYTLIFTKGGYKEAYLRGIRVASNQTTSLQPVTLQKDIEPPYIIDHFPPPGARNVPIDEYVDVLVRFSERMNGASVKNALIVEPPVSYDAFFDRESELSDIDVLHVRLYQNAPEPVQFNTQYQITIMPEAQTPKGIALAQPFRFRFTTDGPLIVDTFPLQGEDGYFPTPQNPIILETNTPVDPSTVERSIRFRPRTDSIPLIKFVHFEHGSNIIVETTLRPDTRYSLQVDNSLRAANGLRFSNTPYSLQFRTAPLGGENRLRSRRR